MLDFYVSIMNLLQVLLYLHLLEKELKELGQIRHINFKHLNTEMLIQNRFSVQST